MKFNKKNTQIKNHEGEKDFNLTKELKLYTAVVTASLSPKFYESENELLTRIKILVSECEPLFVAKLAIYTREKIYLRSVPLVLLVELAKVHHGDSLVQKTTARVVKRADEIMELLAYYQLSNRRDEVKKLNKLSKQIQKGLALAFNAFDEYQFGKYNRQGEVLLKDALFLVHPKAKDEQQQKLFDKIVKGELETPYTWEVELSELGKASFESKEAKLLAKKEKWEELIDSGRLGYMALMRNLRNMLEAKIDKEHLKVVAERLTNPIEIAKAKQFPFRYLSAYRELIDIQSSYTTYLLNALEKAVLVSANNIKGFDLDSKVVLASDVSYSMYSRISPKSTIFYYDIGLMLSMLLQQRSENVITGIFGDSWKQVNLPKESVLANTLKLQSMEGEVGYSTNGYTVIESLIEKDEVVDKLFFFTDLQMWDSLHGGDSLLKSWEAYKAIAPHAKLYLFDLTGYGTTPISIKENDVFLLAGWSDKVFDILEMIEQGKDAIDTILEIEL